MIDIENEPCIGKQYEDNVKDISPMKLTEE